MLVALQRIVKAREEIKDKRANTLVKLREYSTRVAKLQYRRIRRNKQSLSKAIVLDDWLKSQGTGFPDSARVSRRCGVTMCRSEVGAHQGVRNWCCSTDSWCVANRSYRCPELGLKLVIDHRCAPNWNKSARSALQQKVTDTDLLWEGKVGLKRNLHALKAKLPSLIVQCV